MYPWQEQVAQHEKKGELPRATVLLEGLLRSNPSQREQLEILSALMKLSVQQSRHGEAYRYARIYEEQVGLRHLPWWVSCFFTYLVGFFYFCGIRKFRFLTSYLAKYISLRLASPELPPEHFVWLIYANYWNNIRDSSTYALGYMYRAENLHDELLSVGFLAYSAAYAGHSTVGLTLLKKLVEKSERLQVKSVEPILLVHFAIANQMSARPNTAIRLYREIEEKFPDGAAFFKSLSKMNRITTLLVEVDIKSAEQAIDECFSHSFASNDSRNHIQIYGSKAIILALEGNRENALSFIEKAAVAARTSNDRLDYIIFHRIAAVFYMEMEDWDRAEKMLALCWKYCVLYGMPAWAVHECFRIDAILKANARKGVVKRPQIAFQFFVRTLAIRNISIFIKGLRLLPNLTFARYPSYWALQDLPGFLNERLKQNTLNSSYGFLTSLSTKLSEVILDKANWENTEELTQEYLVSQIYRVFGPLTVYVSDSIQSLLGELRKDKIVNGRTIFNDDGDRLKVPCVDDTFFVGLLAPKTAEYQRPMAIGVRLAHLDLVTESLAEAALRIIVTNFVFLQSNRTSRERYVNAQKENALAFLATQVAHDIRSPLTALGIVLETNASKLSEPHRVLAREAHHRIRDIANNLLNANRSKAQVGDTSIVSEVEMLPVLLSGLIDRIVTEKRIQFRSRLGITIENRAEVGSSHLFSKLDPGQLKVVISNLIDNSVDAIDDSGMISVDITSQKDKILLTIEDTGKGIPSKMIPLLGKRGVTLGKSDGNGLGLAHAREVVGKWGGTLMIESIEGKGTRITLVLPQADCPSWFASEIVIPKGSILAVVDDDSSIHQVWEDRIRTTHDFDGVVQIKKFASPDEFFLWNQKENEKGTSIFYLIDFEFLGHAVNGLQLIEKCQIKDRSILVTSRFEQQDILERCAFLGVKLLPKILVNHVSLSLREC